MIDNARVVFLMEKSVFSSNEPLELDTCCVYIEKEINLLGSVTHSRNNKVCTHCDYD